MSPCLVKMEQDTTDTTNNRGLSIERGLFSTSYCPHDRFYISTYLLWGLLCVHLLNTINRKQSELAKVSKNQLS